MDDGEAEAAGIVFGGEEIVEDMGEIFGGDAGAGVADRDADAREPLPVFEEVAEADFDGDLAVGSDGFGGVEEDIGKDLEEGGRVALDGGEVGQIGVEPDLGFGEHGRGEGEDFGEDFLELAGDVLCDGGVAVFEHGIEDSEGAVDGFVGHFQELGGGFRGLFLEGVGGVEAAFFEDGERVADFVGDLGGELAEGGLAVELFGVGFGGFELGIDFFVGADSVEDDGELVLEGLEEGNILGFVGDSASLFS